LIVWEHELKNKDNVINSIKKLMDGSCV
jgi:hypothetical protein